MNIKKNKATKALILALAVTGLTGVSAYFTDRVESEAKVTAGTVGITEADTWDDNLKDADGDRVLDNINPGDTRSLKFTVTNTGNKAVDVRHSLKLSITDANNPTLLKPMSMGADVAGLEMLQFEVFKASDVEFTSEANGNKGYKLKSGAVPMFSTDSVDGTTLMGAQRAIDTTNGTVTYYFADSILDGVGAADKAEVGYAKAEHLDTKLVSESTAVGAVNDVVLNDGKNAVTYDYVLIFRDTALNDFQGSIVHIDLEVEAKQHLNTNSSWQHVETITTTLGTSGIEDQNPSAIVTQNGTDSSLINVVPDNHVGVLEDVTDATAGDDNTNTEH